MEQADTTTNVMDSLSTTTEPCSVTITVNKFSNIIPSDFLDNNHGDSQNDVTLDDTNPSVCSTTSNNISKCMLSETTNINDDIGSMFHEVDDQLSDVFYTDDSVDHIPSDVQMFQANKKISKVLRDSGSFDSINDAQVLKHRLRSLEIEKLALMVDHNNLIREFNSSVESHLEEIRNLNEMNENYDREVQELRDLTCYLDDDRKKYKKMAKEWQKFGRHMVSVLKNEVTAYQDKMSTLESKQKILISENIELRDLCVHLDRQKSTVSKDTTDQNDSSIKLIVCSECSALETPKGKWKGTTKPKASGENYRKTSAGGISMQKQPMKSDDVLLSLEKEQDELRKILMYRNDSRTEKKKVKFDFPDDSDSSTTSDLDGADFPPRIAEFERKTKLSKAFPNLSISEGESTPVNLERVSPPKTNILKKFDEENLSSDHLFFPTSPRKSSSKQDSNIEDHDTRIEELKSELNDSIANTFSVPDNVTPLRLQASCSKEHESTETTFERINFNEDPFDQVEINPEYI